MSKGRGQRGIRRIADDADYEQEFAGISGDAGQKEAIVEIDKLLDKSRRTPKQRNRLGQLADALVDHEAAHQVPHSLSPSASSAEVLHFLMEDGKRVSPQTVAAATGIDLDTLLEYLRDVLEMSRQHKQALARYFNVQPSVFAGGKRA